MTPQERALYREFYESNSHDEWDNVDLEEAFSAGYRAAVRAAAHIAETYRHLWGSTVDGSQDPGPTIAAAIRQPEMATTGVNAVWGRLREMKHYCIACGQVDVGDERNVCQSCTAKSERRPATHRCKQCGGLWLLCDEFDCGGVIYEGGHWHQRSATVGKCCDNVEMDMERLSQSKEGA